MNTIINLFKDEHSLAIIFIINVVVLFLGIVNIIYMLYIKNKYIAFMKKIGNGSNVDEMLKDYLKDVKQVKKDNSEIKAYYTKLDQDISSCIQKIGLVRYNAFRDVGSDLSFAIALLDRENNGVVLNGLYGSESSNIYAKPIKNGKSTYQLSDEENYAIEIAEQNKNFVAKNRKFN